MLLQRPRSKQPQSYGVGAGSLVLPAEDDLFDLAASVKPSASMVYTSHLHGNRPRSRA